MMYGMWCEACGTLKYHINGGPNKQGGRKEFRNLINGRVKIKGGWELSNDFTLLYKEGKKTTCFHKA